MHSRYQRSGRSNLLIKKKEVGVEAQRGVRFWDQPARNRTDVGQITSTIVNNREMQVALKYNF